MSTLIGLGKIGVITKHAVHNVYVQDVIRKIGNDHVHIIPAQIDIEATQYSVSVDHHGNNDFI